MLFYIKQIHIMIFIQYCAIDHAKITAYINCSAYPLCKNETSHSPIVLDSHSSDTSIRQHLSLSLECWGFWSFEQWSAFECRLDYNSHEAIHRRWFGWSHWDCTLGSWGRWRNSILHKKNRKNNSETKKKKSINKTLEKLNLS